MKGRDFTPQERAEYRALRRAESRELIESAARELLTSDGWRRYAEVRAAFHRYSANNCMLIAMQRPDASRVAGFRKWQELGRQVRKGEHAIRILAPHTFKSTDPDTGDDVDRVYFRAVAVFDVAQTEGDPLPEAPCEPLTGDSHAAMLPRLERFADSIGWTVESGDTGNADGWAMPSEERIRISDRCSSRTAACARSSMSSFTRWASATASMDARSLKCLPKRPRSSRADRSDSIPPG